MLWNFLLILVRLRFFCTTLALYVIHSSKKAKGNQPLHSHLVKLPSWFTAGHLLSMFSTARRLTEPPDSLIKVLITLLDVSSLWPNYLSKVPILTLTNILTDDLVKTQTFHTQLLFLHVRNYCILCSFRQERTKSQASTDDTVCQRPREATTAVSLARVFWKLLLKKGGLFLLGDLYLSIFFCCAIFNYNYSYHGMSSECFCWPTCWLGTLWCPISSSSHPYFVFPSTEVLNW